MIPGTHRSYINHDEYSEEVIGRENNNLGQYFLLSEIGWILNAWWQHWRKTAARALLCYRVWWENAPQVCYGRSQHSWNMKPILKFVYFHENRGSRKYRELRLGYNGKCRNLYPRVILRPESTKDVAIAVRVAKKLKMEVIVMLWNKVAQKLYYCLCENISVNATV